MTTLDSIVSVITKAPSQDLTTLEVVKDELKIDGNDQDVRLTRWITETSRYAARWCNRVLALETVSQRWRPDAWWCPPPGDPAPLLLQRWPIVEIVSVTEEGNPALPPENYEADFDSGRLWRVNDTSRGWWPITVTVVYSGGYDVPAKVPPDLQQACLMLMKIRQDTNDRDRMLRAQTTPGVLEEQWWNPATPGQPGMPPEIAEILAPFRQYNAP